MSSINVDATYEDGAFKPTEPLSLGEHARVHLTIVPTAQAASPGDDATLAAVTAITKQLFGNDYKAVWKADPEISGEHFLAFYVTASGSVEEIADREDSWHRNVLAVAATQLGRYRLAVMVR